MAQPTFATAVRLVRDALALSPVERADPVEELEAQLGQAERWALRVTEVVRHMTEEERVSLIALQARVTALLALQIPERERSLMLAMMAGEAEAD